MKVYTMNELLDRDLGPVGTTERDDFEKKVSDDIHAYHVGEAIRKARLSRHLTQEQLGEKVGVQRSQISRLEKGSSITFSTLIRILRALGISASLDMRLDDERPALGVPAASQSAQGDTLRVARERQLPHGL